MGQDRCSKSLFQVLSVELFYITRTSMDLYEPSHFEYFDFFLLLLHHLSQTGSDQWVAPFWTNTSTQAVRPVNSQQQNDNNQLLYLDDQK